MAAVEFAKSVLSREADPGILKTALDLSRRLDQMKLMGESIRSNPELIGPLMEEDGQQILDEFARLGFDFSDFIEHFRHMPARYRPRRFLREESSD